MGRRPILCTLDGRDLTDRARWEDRYGHAFCTLAEMEAWENEDEPDNDDPPPREAQ